MTGGLPAIPLRGAVSPCVQRGCSACCHDIEMLLTEADVARIGAARPGVDFHFRADDGYLQLRTRDGPPAAGWWGGDGVAKPGGRAPRPCIFLENDGRCGIHDVRPEGCRLYPATWIDEARQAELDPDYCPHTDGFALDGETTRAVRDVARRLAKERKARVLTEHGNHGTHGTR